jgi:hypothetical protein
MLIAPKQIVRSNSMRRTLGLLVPVVLLVAPSLFAADPSRQELLKTPKFSEAKPAKFQAFTPEALRDAIKVFSRRNYAWSGFNDSAVTVRLPAVTNSIYATVDFDPPVLKDKSGKNVPFELEQGIFDFDTSSTEVRVQNKGGKGPVDFAHVAGKLKVKYPLVVKTTSVKPGGSKDVKIDGPYVSYNSTAIKLPEAQTFSTIKPLRAYDASGKELERASDGSSSLAGDVSWRQIPFYGQVAEVRMDQVDKWGEVAVTYDLPPVPKLPADQSGSIPPLEERLKVSETPGGKVTKTIKP